MSTRMYAGVAVTARVAARREALLDAGLTVLSAGYTKASVRAICTIPRLSTRQFYAEFASREELMRILLQRIADEGWYAYLRAGLPGYVEVLGSDPRKARLVVVESVAVEAVGSERVEFTGRWAWAEGVDPLRAAVVVGAVNALALEWATTTPQTPLADALGALDGIIGINASPADAA